MAETQLNPLHAFAIIMVGAVIVVTGFISGLDGYMVPFIDSDGSTIELWSGGVLLTDNKIYGDIFEYERKYSITVTVKNPTSRDLKFGFTHECYPENLSVGVQYGQVMPVAIARGTSVEFGIQYWVKDSDFDITLVDIWFNMGASG